MSNNKGTRWITPILILMAAIVVLVGLIISLALMRPIDSRIALVTPTTSTILPSPSKLTPISTSAVAQNASLTPLPMTTPQVTTSSTQPTPQIFLGEPFTYGTSVHRRPLWAYRFGAGSSACAIIGGIHGGYEWNTVVLMSETMEYLQANPTLVPDEITLYVIPCANPDGYATSRGLEGRVNANGVDLNRNWGYQWQPTATHGTRPVDPGMGPFSEPETAALRDFILGHNVEAAIFYHSAMARVFYGVERDKSASYELAQAVSQATSYPIADGVPGQITTGDAVDWMSDQGLAGIEVELTTHEDIEWERNLQGLRAFLDWAPSPYSLTPIVETSQIGISVQGRSIEVTQVGDGDQVALVIIGSIHGDEANTEALVRDLMVQYASEPELVPLQFALYFVPTMNPDGLAAGTRHNANDVDLNRNWPTEDWRPDAARTRGTVPGSGGTAPGSEPEVQAASRWLLDVVKPGAQEVWLLSYHSAYPPGGGVQPGYTVYGVPGPQAEQLAQRVADVSSYTYLPSWTSEYTFTGELIHWCDVNGIWAADVELPDHDPPDTIPAGKSEPTLTTHRHVMERLLTILDPAVPTPGDDGYIHYTVKPGDSLLGIAFQFEGEMEAALRLKEEIMRLNGIDDENLIGEGDVLRIPLVVDNQP